jgi:hypothetical protein
MNTLRFALCLVITLGLAAGCSKPDRATAPQAGGHGHDHPEKGPHGGALAEWGDEEFHVEFTVDHDKKQVVVYVLDGSAAKAPAVTADAIAKVSVQLANVDPPVTIELKHDPKESGEKGIAFSGTHDKLAAKMDFRGTVAGTVNGKPFQGEFDEKGHGH